MGYAASSGRLIRYQYVNPDIPAGNTVASSLTSNPKTAFATQGTISEDAAFIGAAAQLKASGTWSTVASLPLTLSVAFQGITIGSATLPVGALSGVITTHRWTLDLEATIQNGGNIEVQGQAIFWTSGVDMIPIEIRNTSQFTMSTIGGVPFDVSVQWGALSVGGTITMRQLELTVI